MAGEVVLTSTKGQASDTNPIQATSVNIEALGEKVPIDICPGQPCPNVDSHRVFMLHERQARVGGMSTTLDGE